MTRAGADHDRAPEGVADQRHPVDSTVVEVLDAGENVGRGGVQVARPTEPDPQRADAEVRELVREPVVESAGRAVEYSADPADHEYGRPGSLGVPQADLHRSLRARDATPVVCHDQRTTCGTPTFTRTPGENCAIGGPTGAGSPAAWNKASTEQFCTSAARSRHGGCSTGV